MSKLLSTSKKLIRTRLRNRIIKYSLGSKNIRGVIGAIYPDMEIFGINNGQFSLINLVDDIISQVDGPIDIDISSFAVAGFESSRIVAIQKSDKVRRLRLVVDSGIRQLKPSVFRFLHTSLGEQRMRLVRCHCKFVVIKNQKWHIVVRTSMNLNQNKRLENFEISDCELLSDYLNVFVDEIFQLPYDAKGVKIQNIKRHQDIDGLDFSLSDLGNSFSLDDLFSSDENDE